MHQIAESPALFGGPMHIGMKHRAFVYHKCGELPEWDDFKLKDERGWRVYRSALPNFGFEAHTYLHHMVEHYDDLAEITIFLQGNPFLHAENLLDETLLINYTLPMTWLVVFETQNAIKENWFTLRDGLREQWEHEGFHDGSGSEHDDWNDDAYLGGSSGLDNCEGCRVMGTLGQTLKLPPSKWKSHGKVGTSSIQSWLHAREKAYPWSCSLVGDIQDFFRAFWPEFSLSQKRCFHAPPRAQFALKASAIQQHPKERLRKAVDLLTPGVGLEAFIKEQNQRGGVCNTLTNPCDSRPAPGVIAKCRPSCADHVDSMRGKQLALRLPWQKEDGTWARKNDLNATHCEASYATAILLETSWHLLFSGDDGCITDWRAAMPLRAHAHPKAVNFN